MKASLHTVRDNASFSARWYLVPFALCTVAFVAVVVAQALAADDSEVEAVIEVPVAAPAQADAHGT
jgi:hypothetical protein